MNDSQAVTPAKRGRGRPRKDPSEVSSQKKANGSITKGKPGRKPGSKNKPKQEGEFMNKSLNAQSGEKRSRGRPRKEDGEKVSPKKKAFNPAAPGEKRGRGRPRKDTSDVEMSQENAAQNSESDQ